MNACRAFALFLLATSVAIAYAPSLQACVDGVDRVAERTSDFDLLKGAGHLSATGDFDGDGRIDEAFFVRRGRGFSLVVCLDGGKRLVRLLDNIRTMVDTGVRTARPGPYPHLCAGSVGPPCQEGDLLKLELRRKAIEYYEYECCSHLHYWNGKTFKRFWTSD